jgi:hypothetical protein
MRVGSSRDTTDNCQKPSGGSSANQITINLGGSTLIVVVLLTVVIGACGGIIGMDISDRHAVQREADMHAQNVQREADMKVQQLDRDFKEASTRLMLNERRLMDKEAYMILNGEKIPGDDTHGPTGNLERMKPKEH